MLLNAPRMQRLMNEADVGFVVATSPTNVRYVTDHACSLEHSITDYMFMIDGDASPFFQSAAIYDGTDTTLLVHALLAVTTVGRWTGHLRVYGAEPTASSSTGNNAVDSILRATAESHPHDFVHELAAGITAQTKAGERVAVDPDGLTDAQWDSLVDLLSDRIVLRAPVLFRICRMVKTADEIARSEAGASASESAYLDMLDAGHAGTCADELAAVYRRRLSDSGAGLAHCAFGNYGLGIVTSPSQYAFSAGDVMFADVGCTLNGVVTDTGGTLSIGQPREVAARHYAAVRDSLEAGLQVLRPGATAADVYEAMTLSLREAGVEGAAPQGHGLGIEPKEYPFIAGYDGVHSDDCITVDVNIVLEQGMVINLEVPLFVAPDYSVHLEKTFVLTSKSTRALIPQDRAEIVVIEG